MILHRHATNIRGFRMRKHKIHIRPSAAFSSEDIQIDIHVDGGAERMRLHCPLQLMGIPMPANPGILTSSSAEAISTKSNSSCWIRALSRGASPQTASSPFPSGSYTLQRREIPYVVLYRSRRPAPF